MAPAPPNVVNAGDAPRRGASVNPNSLDSTQRAITRDSIPVRTRPLTGSSSPVRQQSIRPSAEKRKQLLNKNPYAPLATEDHGADDHFADAEAIEKCAEQFSSGYGKRFAQHLRTTLLQHWSAASSGEASPAPGHTATFGGTKNASRAPPPEEASTFAGIARAAHETQPGNRKIAPKLAPRRPRAPRNDKRVLIRLQKDSTFFDKGLQIQLAIRDRLHLQLADQQWGPLVGLEIAEKDTEWHTYLIKNFPTTITSWDGTELDYKSTVEEAIKEQTGLHPIQWRSTDTGDPTTTTLVIHFDQPLKSRFRLLGLGDLSF
ncbi:hypothetical protein ARSEF1564_004235 [Beauveria bassiana]